jgi:hypothetical protein
MENAISAAAGVALAFRSDLQRVDRVWSTLGTDFPCIVNERALTALRNGHSVRQGVRSVNESFALTKYP